MVAGIFPGGTHFRKMVSGIVRAVCGFILRFFCSAKCGHQPTADDFYGVLECLADVFCISDHVVGENFCPFLGKIHRPGHASPKRLRNALAGIKTIGHCTIECSTHVLRRLSRFFDLRPKAPGGTAGVIHFITETLSGGFCGLSGFFHPLKPLCGHVPMTRRLLGCVARFGCTGSHIIQPTRSITDSPGEALGRSLPHLAGRNRRCTHLLRPNFNRPNIFFEGFNLFTEVINRGFSTSSIKTDTVLQVTRIIHVVSPPDAQKKKPALERVRLSFWFCFFTPLLYPQAFGLTALLVLCQIHLTQFCVGHAIARPHHAPKALVDFGFVGSTGNVQFSCEETARWRRSASRRSSGLRCRQSIPCPLP